jgi:hypothetical protein
MKRTNASAPQNNSPNVNRRVAMVKVTLIAASCLVGRWSSRRLYPLYRPSSLALRYLYCPFVKFTVWIWVFGMQNIEFKFEITPGSECSEFRIFEIQI